MTNESLGAPLQDCTDRQLHVNFHTEFPVFIQVMRMFYLFRNARIVMLSALLSLLWQAEDISLDGRTVFVSGCLDFLLVGWRCVSAG